MIDMRYSVLELKEENGEIWARIKVLENKPDDLAIAAPLQELERRCEPFGLQKSEALNWLLTFPGLDEFFGQVAEHKKKVMQ